MAARKSGIANSGYLPGPPVAASASADAARPPTTSARLYLQHQTEHVPPYPLREQFTAGDAVRPVRFIDHESERNHGRKRKL